MISREKALEWAKEADIHTYPEWLHGIRKEKIEALINRAYAEGQKDMRERAANVCDQLSYRFVSEAILNLEIE